MIDIDAIHICVPHVIVGIDVANNEQLNLFMNPFSTKIKDVTETMYPITCWTTAKNRIFLII